MQRTEKNVFDLTTGETVELPSGFWVVESPATIGHLNTAVLPVKHLIGSARGSYIVGMSETVTVVTDRENQTCGCTSHDPADHQGSCGHCGAVEDAYCRPGCPVDGTV